MVCHMPPPVHGAAVMGQRAAEAAMVHALFEVCVIPIRVNKELGAQQRFSFGKLFSSLRLIVQVFRAVVAWRPAAMYFTANLTGFAFWRDLIAVLLCRLAGVRRILHFHMKGMRAGYERSRLMRAGYRMMFHDADVVHLSQRLYSDVEPVVSPRRFHVVANGVHVASAPVANEAAADEIQTVLFLSNLYESKGPLDLLEASTRLAARGVAHKLIYAGAGAEAHVVQRLCKADGHVKWVGPVRGEAKAALLRSADVFVFPTYYRFECQPLAVIEAMAYGKAIIASDEAAIPDLIHDGQSGLLVRARAIDELVNAMSLLLLHPGLRAKLGAAARARYEECFTLEKFEQTLAGTLWRIAVAPSERAPDALRRTG